MPETKPARTTGKLHRRGVYLVFEEGDNALIAQEICGPNRYANAEHAIACWNLVEDFGGDPEAVRRALDALQSIARRVVRASHPSQAQEPLVRDARAALDALGRK